MWHIGHRLFFIYCDKGLLDSPDFAGFPFDIPEPDSLLKIRGLGSPGICATPGICNKIDPTYLLSRKTCSWWCEHAPVELTKHVITVYISSLDSTIRWVDNRPCCLQRRAVTHFHCKNFPGIRNISPLERMAVLL